MKAIVLTYDKYMVLADHMITQYQNLWPENPFIYKIPYQSDFVKNYFEEKYGNKVEMLKSPSGIVETMEHLLEGFHDDDWVYWCMDDRYPISLNTQAITNLYQTTKQNIGKEISGLMFINSEWGHLPENLYYRKFKKVNEAKQVLLRRKGYRMIWLHQFVRVKVLKTMFDNFRVKMAQAKDMDFILYTLKLPDSQRLYTLNRNVAIFGESTSRGKLTINCEASLKKNGFEIPRGFTTGNKKIIQGTNTMLDNFIYFIKHRVKKIIGIKEKE